MNYIESGLSFGEMDFLESIIDRLEIDTTKSKDEQEDELREKIGDAVSDELIPTHKNWEICEACGYDWSELDGTPTSVEELASLMVYKLLYEYGGYEYIASKVICEPEESDDEDESEDE